MPDPGGHGPPEPLGEQRLRIAPRPVRTSPVPEADPLPVPEPPPPPPVFFPETPSEPFRPDRSRMDPLSLDRSNSRKVTRTFHREKKDGKRSYRSVKIDRLLKRILFSLLIVGVCAFAFKKINGWLKRNASNVFAPPVVVHAVRSVREQVPDMLEAFLTAPDAAAKSAFVLDRQRVLPLMEEAYAKGGLPEEHLRFGVAQAMDTGLWAVPSRVLGPDAFALHLLVKDDKGEPRLDWETYYQELSRSFAGFTAQPGAPDAVFRLVLERAHPYAAAPDEKVAVRLSPPGAVAMDDPVIVRTDVAAALADTLPWNRRRRALVRLGWQLRENAAPRLILNEVVKWDFLPD